MFLGREDTRQYECCTGVILVVPAGLSCPLAGWCPREWHRGHLVVSRFAVPACRRERKRPPARACQQPMEADETTVTIESISAQNRNRPRGSHLTHRARTRPRLDQPQIVRQRVSWAWCPAAQVNGPGGPAAGAAYREPPRAWGQRWEFTPALAANQAPARSTTPTTNETPARIG